LQASDLLETSQVHKLDEEVCARRKREKAKNQLHVNRAHQAIARMLLEAGWFGRDMLGLVTCC
jgi:hypothetical protein